MLSLALSLALCAASPDATRAQSLAASQSWDELYLAFAATKPDGFQAKDRKAIAAALLQGALALEPGDAVLAASLAEKSVAFEPSPLAYRCSARMAAASDQKAAAEELLRAATARFPKDSALALDLGQFLLEDENPAGAIAALLPIPKRAPEHAKAQVLLEHARAKLAEADATRRQARRIESRTADEGTQRRAQERVVPSASSGGSFQAGTGPGGVRVRSNDRFVFKYFGGERDFGQRAEYEGKVAAALDAAYAFSQRELGRARHTPVDVVLYTRDEFALHHGKGAAQAFAGLYSNGAMRISDAAEISERTQATLVHEYIHAVVDELSGGRAERVPTWLNEGLAELLEWRYQGSDRPPLWLSTRLREAARSGALPSLRQMETGMLAGQPNAPLRYGTCALAVKALLRDGGTGKLLSLLGAVGEGRDFAAAYAAQYGKTLETLERDVQSEAARR